MKKIFINIARKTLQKINFIKDFNLFKKLSDNRFKITWKERWECLSDKTQGTEFDRHYVLHPAWAARKLVEIKPDFHIDISSSLHFCTIVSAFINVKFYDYRPASLNLSNLESEHADITSLPFSENSIKSLSCMHVVEHIGLGRYGDPIDPAGDLKAISELKRVLAPGGYLLFVVPVGKPKIQYNAHRIYSYDQIKNYFNDLQLEEFSLIPDDCKDHKGIIYNAKKQDADRQSYGCGCFLFKKE